MEAREQGGGLWASLRHAFAIPEQDVLSEREKQWLRRLADEIVRRRLSTPAVFMLETARPLNYLGAHVLMFFKPIISIVFPARDCEGVARLLEKRGAIPALIEMIQGGGQDETDPTPSTP